MVLLVRDHVVFVPLVVVVVVAVKAVKVHHVCPVGLLFTLANRP